VNSHQSEKHSFEQSC